jgi:hypothetical protein
MWPGYSTIKYKMQLHLLIYEELFRHYYYCTMHPGGHNNSKYFCVNLPLFVFMFELPTRHEQMQDIYTGPCIVYGEWTAVSAASCRIQRIFMEDLC